MRHIEDSQCQILAIFWSRGEILKIFEYFKDFPVLARKRHLPVSDRVAGLPGHLVADQSPETSIRKFVFDRSHSELVLRINHPDLYRVKLPGLVPD